MLQNSHKNFFCEFEHKRNIVRILIRYFITIFLSIIATVVAGYCGPYTHYHSTVLIFIAYIILINIAYGAKAGLFSTLLSMLLYNYFLLEPVFSLDIEDPSDIFTYAAFFVVALPTGYLVAKVRNEAKRAMRSADLVTALLGATHELYGAIGPKDVARVFAVQMQSLCNRRIVLFFASQGRLEIVACAFMPADEARKLLTLANANWHSPFSTRTQAVLCDGTHWTFEVLGGDHDRVGLAAFESGVEIESRNEVLSSALRRQGVIALERALLIADRGEAEALRRSQKLHDAFLNSVGHDLRMPLTGILGAATTLIDFDLKLLRRTRKTLLLSIRDQAERLNRYVRDLLDMSKIEGGALNHALQPCDIRDILQSAISRVTPRLGRRKVARHFPATVSLVETVPALIEQAVVNILENAIAYSADGSVIEVAAYENSDAVFASIADDGPGIPLADRSRIFEKFYRLGSIGRGDGGSGLGLFIAKGFLEAFDGRIVADDHPSKSGARITLSLRIRSDLSTGNMDKNQLDHFSC